MVRFPHPKRPPERSLSSPARFNVNQHATIALACAMSLFAPVVSAEEVVAPSFLNEVEPLLTRLGCNQGACHGKGVGQNGFRLSLRGYAPEWDHEWITREMNCRRINTASPEDSILLLKPLGLASHEGGKLFKRDSREHRLLLDWIRAGAPG